MSTIRNISGLSNPFLVQSASGNQPSTATVDSDGDNDGSGVAARVGNGSWFMQSILQALEQTVNAGSASSSTAASGASDPSQGSGSTQGVQSAFQGFMHDLFAALHQQNGNGNTPSSGGEAGNQSGSVSGARHSGRHGYMAARVQDLLQQLSASSQSDSAGTADNCSSSLATLNTSFQYLVKAIQNGQSAASASTPTLKSFLQSLQQSLGGGQSISGAVVNTQA